MDLVAAIALRRLDLAISSSQKTTASLGGFVDLIVRSGKEEAQAVPRNFSWRV
jgi:hypothetical protein